MFFVNINIVIKLLVFTNWLLNGKLLHTHTAVTNSGIWHWTVFRINCNSKVSVKANDEQSRGHSYGRWWCDCDSSWCWSTNIICHHFWLAPLRVHSTTCSQQPPERTILSHIDCFSQCEIMGLKVSDNQHSRNAES